jgi:hypothetical protein
MGEGSEVGRRSSRVGVEVNVASPRAAVAVGELCSAGSVLVCLVVGELVVCVGKAVRVRVAVLVGTGRVTVRVRVCVRTLVAVSEGDACDGIAVTLATAVACCAWLDKSCMRSGAASAIRVRGTGGGTWLEQPARTNSVNRINR